MNYISTKIAALSNKFASYCKPQTHLDKNIDTEIMGDDLQYNLSAILTDILLALFAPSVTEANIQAVIDQYNTDNNTTYSFSYFYHKGWIRYINGKYVVPAAVRSNIWKVEKPDVFNRHGNPVDMEADTRAMLPVLILLRENEDTLIDAATLTTIIQRYSPELNADFFTRKNILNLKPDGSYQLGNQKDYFWQLRNRIAANGWRKIMGNSETLDDFRKYLRFLDFVEAYPDQLETYLPHYTIEKIKELSLQLLNEETDLREVENEVRNSRLDEDHTKHVKLSDPVPTLTFATDDLYTFAKQLQHYRVFDDNLFLLNYSRNAHHIAIKFIVDFDFGDKRFSTAIELLKETANPYIKAFIIWLAEHTYPEMLPYFLTNVELAPLSFMLLDEQKVNDRWLQQGVNFNDNLVKSDRILDELWNETLDILMELATTAPHPDEYGKPFAALLKELAHQTFYFNPSNYHRSTQLHQRSKDRYDRVLTALKSARLALKNHFPKARVKPLLSAFILPGMVDSLEEFPEFPWRNGMLPLDNDQIDLKIELLRLSRADFSDDALYPQNALLNTLPERISHDIYAILNTYFTRTDIEAERGINEIESMPVKRTSSNFGIEILDVAYLLANFEQFNLIGQLTGEMKKGLTFNTAGNAYDDQNQEQSQKISVFLKLLLVGYIGLSERKEKREYDNLPAKETLKELQELIGDLALTYNTDDLGNSLMDVFTFRSYLFTRDLYSQELDALLYQARSIRNRQVTDRAGIFIFEG